MRVTEHATKRIKERLGISKRLADANAQRALQYGITHREVKGSLRKYMDKLYLKYRTANNMRIYNRKIYIFNGETLITVFNLPNKFLKTTDKLNKKKNETYQCNKSI